MQRWSLIITILFNLCSMATADDCHCALCELDKLPDNCTTMYGHIQMGLEATMPPFEIIEYKLENVTKIVGCVTIANSGFTTLGFFSNLLEIQYSQTNNASTCATYGNIITIAKNSLLRRLYFENLGKVIVSEKSEYGIYIVDNPSLCISEKELENFMTTSKFYAPHIQICDPKKFYCRLDNFDFFDDTNIPIGCQILTDSLVLNGTTNTGNATEFQNRLNDIEQIFGSIIVLESYITSLAFPNLWRIYNFQPDLPIILVQNNEFLCHLEMPNLSSIPYFGTWPDALYSYSNPLLTEISVETCQRLSKLGEITFDDNSTNTVCHNQSKPVSNFVNSTVIFPPGETNKHPNDTRDNHNFRVYQSNFLFSCILFFSLIY